MDIVQSRQDDVATLKLSGEIDLHVSPRLRAVLMELAAEKTPALLLDFSDVQYIDSSGLATLIEYVRECKAYGGNVALFGLQPKVKMVFELVRLNELFKIADSHGAAAQAVREP
jgi:anti-sigma B factor antagonist